MKNKIILLLLAAIAVFAFSACGAKKEIVGSWHLTEFAGGQSLSEYAESVGLNEILVTTTYVINEDGTFRAESGLSLAMGQEGLRGTWEYSNGSYFIGVSEENRYQVELKDGKLNIYAADGTMVFEPGAADIDVEEAKRAYAGLMENPDDTKDDNSPSETEKPSVTASPGAIEETGKPKEEETPAPESIHATNVYDNIIGKIWVDDDGNYYDFYDDNTCYVKYKNGNELTGEYQLIDDTEGIVFDVILNESEQLRSLTKMEENTISFKDTEGNEFILTKVED